MQNSLFKKWQGFSFWEQLFLAIFLPPFAICAILLLAALWLLVWIPMIAWPIFSRLRTTNPKTDEAPQVL